MDANAVIRELVSRARAGDQGALGELLDNHRGQLRAMAEKLLDDRGAARIDASDVVQQTCLSVHQQIAEFDGQDPGQFVAWLRQIHERNIQNAARDQLRARKRAIDREEPLGDANLHAASQTSPSQHAVREEESVRLARAIALLPEDEREALRRRYLEGQSLGVVAEAMELTKDRLVWLMKRAMKNLRKHLGNSD